jgi:hypothetical protein
MVAAPSAAALAALDSVLSRAKPVRSSKIGAAFALALSFAVIGPVTVYAVTRDPPMSAAESVVLRAMVDYTARRTGEPERVIWGELRLSDTARPLSAGVTRCQWAGALKYLTNRITLE